jgi:hypothetical protein
VLRADARRPRAAQLILHSVGAYAALCAALLGAPAVLECCEASAEVDNASDDSAAARLATTRAAYADAFGAPPPARIWGADAHEDAPDAPEAAPAEAAPVGRFGGAFDAADAAAAFSITLLDFRGGAPAEALGTLTGLSARSDVRALRAAAAARCGVSPAAALPLRCAGVAGALRDGMSLEESGIAHGATVLAIAREPWRSACRAGDCPATHPARCALWRSAPPPPKRPRTAA